MYDSGATRMRVAMDPQTIIMDALLFLLVFGTGSAGFIKHMVGKRNEHKLTIEQQRTRQEEAKAKQLEEKNRAAELELERFDRSISGQTPVPHLPSSADPDDRPGTPPSTTP
jgi:uncharacterized protein HemX